MTMATISNGECGDGGWTLVMKIDGNQVKLKMNEWMNEWMNWLIDDERLIHTKYYIAQFTLVSVSSYFTNLRLPPSNGNRENWRKPFEDDQIATELIFKEHTVAESPSKVFWYFPKTILLVSTVDSR